MQTKETNFKSKIQEKRVLRWVRRGNSSHGSAFGNGFYDAVLKLDDMRLLLNRLYGVGLTPAPVLDAGRGVKSVKEFCGQLLERCVPNHWKTTLRKEKKVSLKVRLTVASSLFSLRKILPGDKPNVMEYVQLMTGVDSPVSEDFLRFSKAEIKKIFTRGWDAGYWRHVESFTPPTKSNIDKENLGTYRSRSLRGDLTRDRFRRWAGGVEVEPIRPAVRATAVCTSGKWRVITLASAIQANLKPLHKTMYDWLSKESWLLRGEATPEKFSDFLRIEGEEFVSGDYEGATDNISRRLYTVVIDEILSSCTHVPLKVREQCRSLTDAWFCSEEGNFLGFQSRGQLMGSVMSFPVLCLINYLTFRFSVGREVPVKINGDDIVFRSTPEEAARWAEQVSASGLRLSLGKTLRHTSVFSLNSTYFHATNLGVTLNPLIRASVILKKCEDMEALAGRVTRVGADLAGSGLTKIRVTASLLSRNLSLIYAAQGSFARRYSTRLSTAALRAAGMLDRESFYLGLHDEPSALEPYRKVRQNVVPAEWVKSSRLMGVGARVPDSVVRTTMIDNSWTAEELRETEDEYWSRVRDGSYRYVPFSSRALRLFRLAGGRYTPQIPSGVVKEKFWATTGRCGGPERGPVAFVRGMECPRSTV